MKKPTLLYVSPLPPDQSGISDYSSVLVKNLRDRFDITLYSDIRKEDLSDNSLNEFPLLTVGVDPLDVTQFDYCIYNIGNNPHFHEYIYELALIKPGLVILHDYIIYYLFIGYYQKRDILYSSIYCGLGLHDFLSVKEVIRRQQTDLLMHNELAAKMPMNRELLRSGNKIMVHSEYARQKIMETGSIRDDHVRHINLIRQIVWKEAPIPREELFRKYRIPTDALVIASFGFVDTRKMNREICHAVRRVKDETGKKICYVMVGAGDYADEELENGFIVKTGFTALEEFDSFVQFSDIIVNLRNPTMGETSGAMLRILQLGKACITNNGGWFSELPGDCVYKIELDDVILNLTQALEELIQNADMRERIGMLAKEYIDREYDDKKIISQIYDFLCSDQ